MIAKRRLFVWPAVVLLVACGETNRDVNARYQARMDGLRAHLRAIHSRLPASAATSATPAPGRRLDPLPTFDSNAGGNTDFLTEEQLADSSATPGRVLVYSRDLAHCLAWTGPNGSPSGRSKGYAENFERALGTRYLVVIRMPPAGLLLQAFVVDLTNDQVVAATSVSLPPEFHAAKGTGDRDRAHVVAQQQLAAALADATGGSFLIGSESARADARQAAATLAQTRSVRGRLLSHYTGKPVATRDLALADGSTRLATTKTDGDGTFTFGGLPRDGSFTLETPKGDGRWTGVYRLEGLVLVAVRRGPVTELGDILFADDEEVTHSFRSVCTSGKLTGSPPRGGVLVFIREDKGWQHSSPHLASLTRGWTAPWPAAFCIESSSRLSGSYSSRGGVYVPGAARAYDVTWRVRLIRLTDGKTFSTTVSAGAPASIAGDQTFDARGNPTAELQKWLKGPEVSG